MGKKGKKKKKIQKKQQQKAMKQRAKKKAMQKKRPATRSQSTEFPGMPGNLPPEVQAKANLMARFAQPLFEMADATDMEEMQNVATLAQVFWEAYQETDLEKRKAKLDELREHYAEVPWATREFDDLTEQLLKRHIYLLSDTHTEEERNRYTREDLEAAMAAEEPAKEKEEVP
ncbi:MAG: hypothetical protein GWN16_03370, partial [Calditrichae bacterium]|nr:hypothetical protein [Calditrichia bacterium]